QERARDLMRRTPDGPGTRTPVVAAPEVLRGEALGRREAAVVNPFAIDVELGREAPREEYPDVGPVRAELLRDAGDQYLLTLLAFVALPPGRGAAILDVPERRAAEMRENALSILRRER